MTSRAPDFSIIIPTRNRPRALATCLEAASALNYPRDAFEVVIVDDGGTESLQHVMEAIRDRLDIQLLRQERGGPASARNRGAAHAKGRYLAFTDDDCQPDSQWLRALSERFAGSPDVAVGGSTINGLPSNHFSSASQLILEIVYAHYNRDPDRATFFASNNFALPANRFREVGGFEGVFLRAAAEDRDLCDRWLQNGHRIVHEPKAVVRHYHELTLAEFCRQHFNYGRGAYLFHRLRAERGSGRIRIETRLHLEALRRPFRVELGLKRLALMGTLVVWQLANAAGFLWEWLSHRSSPHVGSDRSGA